MLSAMRPFDPRYTAVASPDGRPRGCFGQGRRDAMAGDQPAVTLSQRGSVCEIPATPPGWVGDIPSRHDLYWKTEAAMEEGNPMLILERARR